MLPVKAGCNGRINGEIMGKWEKLKENLLINMN